MGLFIVGVDEYDDVLLIRQTVIDTLKQGGLEVTQWSSENTSVTKTRGMSLTKILEEANLFIREYNGTRIKKVLPNYGSD